MNAPNPDCDRRILARQGHTQIDLCRCGLIQLTIGAFTLRLRRSSFEALAKTVLEAWRRLAQADSPQEAVCSVDSRRLH